MMVGMFASIRGMKLAVLGLARLLAAKKSLEAMVASLAQTPVAELASDRRRSGFARWCFYPSVYGSIEGSRC